LHDLSEVTKSILATSSFNKTQHTATSQAESRTESVDVTSDGILIIDGTACFSVRDGFLNRQVLVSSRELLMIMSTLGLGQLPLLAMVEFDVQLLNLSSLNVLSYNCRGFNEFKIPYIQSLLCRSDVLFIQEHWLSDGQLPILNNLSTSHCSFSVCGYSDEVLQGRPYGGCAILWRQGFCHDIVFLDSGSRRVCAIRYSFDFGNIVFINCYMPYESNDPSRAEFSNHLEVIKCIL